MGAVDASQVLQERASMQMSGALVTASVAFCLAMTGVLFANLSMYKMIKLINQKRGTGPFESQLGFTLAKTIRIHREYRASYPEGRLHRQWWAWLAVGFVSMAIVAASFYVASRLQPSAVRAIPAAAR